MLTLQQLLESDSLSTIVAKLNQNFQSLSLSNGGPQGIRGAQGIPGLPGKQGPIGPTGPAGATAGGVGIIPFACVDSTGATAIGPTVDTLPSVGNVGPWPYSSWEWLQYYHVSGGAGYDGNPPQNQEIYIDPANGGYWQYLETPDDQGASCDGGYTSGGAYSYTGSGSYPDLGPTAGWAGPGWYWYPSSASSSGGGNLGDVWTNDTTTYFISPPNSGPYEAGPYLDEPTPLTIPNARLLSKYGTVWISSGNAGATASADLTESPTIGRWGESYGDPNDGASPARNNAGVDRLLFKMSIDGLPYLSNVIARGYSGATAGSFDPNPTTATYPQNQSSTLMVGDTYWVSPQYNVNLGQFAPLLFLTHRDPQDAPDFGTYGSLGFYMYTATDQEDGSVPQQPSDPYGPATGINNNNVSRTLHVISSRYSADPLSLFANQTVDSGGTKNYGEMVLDVRRVITSNQYVCSLPTDMRLSSDFTIGGDYDENNGAGDNLYPYRSFQGYISAINGKSLTGDPTYSNFWEYGLGGGEDGPAGGYTSGTHDLSSGTAGMQTRRSWYGSSVLSELPTDWDVELPGRNDYIRVAGMMERGRRINNTEIISRGGTGTTSSYFYSELLFYTSQFSVESSSLYNGVGVDNTLVNPDVNEHKSLPSLYVSPFRNIGIGTFAGGATAANDLGPLEPSGKLHVHTKYTNLVDDPTSVFYTVAAGTGYYVSNPTSSFSVAAFTADGTGSRFTDILIGGLSPDDDEKIVPSANIVNAMNDTSSAATGRRIKTAIRSELWNTEDLSSLRLGSQPSKNSARSIGRISVPSYSQEFQLSIHPLTTSATGSLESSLNSISGVGIHALYPRARTHFFGRNVYNETEYGLQPVTVSGVFSGSLSTGLTSTYPFYGPTAVNLPSNNQVIIDYIGDSYTYPVGIKEYQYYAWGATSGLTATGVLSPNSVAYPTRDFLVPTRNAIPYGGPILGNLSYPSTTSGVVLNGSYKHGGTANAWLEPSSYIGFNLFRDLSSGFTGNVGDDRDTTRWMLGTLGDNGLENGNNGGAALFLGTHGELCFATVPRGFNGGRPYESLEQRGYGTRDILNQIKMIIDSHGAVGISNQPGWDYDAYPALAQDPETGYILYTPYRWNANAGAMAAGTAGTINPNTSTYSNTIMNWKAGRRFGFPNYTFTVNGSPAVGNFPGESLSSSPAARVNETATIKDYIRFEVAAEKAWSREGRSLLKQGYGYPPNIEVKANCTAIVATMQKFFRVNGTNPGGSNLTNNWTDARQTLIIKTDSEGRLIEFGIGNVAYSTTPLETGDTYFSAVVIPHPKDFEAGGLFNSYAGVYTAPAGAIAAEWWGMSEERYIDPLFSTYSTIYSVVSGDRYNTLLVFTPDTRGSANIRLNNFVYGEGYGGVFSGTGQVAGLGTGTIAGTASTLPGLAGNLDFQLNRTQGEVYTKWSYNRPDTSDPGTYTARMVKKKRQESPKLIFSFLEKDPSPIGNAFASIVGVPPTKTSDWTNDFNIGTDPYRKVNTVIASAQNEAALREYWIPKTDNTGGTFMVFTDHMGSKEKDDGFDNQLQSTAEKRNKLKLLEVVTMELVQGYTGTGGEIIGFGDTAILAAGKSPNQLNMLYVKYWNRKLDESGTSDQWLPGEFGMKVPMPTWGETAGSTASNVPDIRTAGQSGIGTYSTAVVVGVDNIVGMTPSSPRIRSAIVARNIDKYYEVVHDSAQQNWGGLTNVMDDPAKPMNSTAIRFRRINSEFVLVDYNISVNVLNPTIGPTGIADSYIDGRVPRMTQALKFYYDVDQNEIDAPTPPGMDYRWTESQYGNGPWFSNWSSWRHWLPGSAVVGMDTANPLIEAGDVKHVSGHFYENTSTVDSPFFNLNLTDPNYTQTWNGNFIDAGFFLRGATGATANYIPPGRIFPTFGHGTADPLNQNYKNPNTVIGEAEQDNDTPSNFNYGSPIHGMFDTVYLNAVMSTLLFRPKTFNPDDQVNFMGRIRAYYSIYLGQTMSRVRNTMWRMTPAFVNNLRNQPASLDEPPQRNNTFVLEIMFDVPIMHTDHGFSRDHFSPWDSTLSVYPYKQLTVSGQGIIRYAETIKNVF
jgi:hypothetical protein